MTDFRDAGFPGECCLCGRLVLGLEGQDRFLLSFQLSADWQALAEVAGACHLRCMMTSEYGEIWGVGAAVHYQTRWPRSVEGEGWRVHHDQFWQFLYLTKSNGWIAKVPESALATVLHESEGEVWLPVTSVIGYVDGPYEQAIRPYLKADGGVALPDLLAELDIDDRPLRADVLAGGVVRAGLLREGKGKGALAIEVYEAKHAVAVDRPMWEAAVALTRRR